MEYTGWPCLFSVFTGPREKTAFPTRGYKPAQKLTAFITRGVWSPIVYTKGYRHQDNFRYADWCTLDFDKNASLQDAITEFSNHAHIIGTTKSHTEENHRFRVCIPFSERIKDLAVYRYNMKILTDRYGSDPAAKDGARFFYPCKEIVHVAPQGLTIDVWKKLPAAPKPRPVSVWSGGALPPMLERMLKMRPPVEGDVNNTLYRLACEFAKRTTMGASEIRQHVDHLVYPDPSNESRYMTTINSALRRYRGS